jgi:hypothetical protein
LVGTAKGYKAELGDGTMLKRGGLSYLAAKRLVDAPAP